MNAPDTYLHLDAQFVKAEIAKLIAAEGVAREHARFWSKVSLPHHTQADCWLWTGSTDAKGYGLFRPANRLLIRAHRYCYALFCDLPGDGVLICHSCDNPRCVRPSHLFPGTNADNVADRESKGRGVRLSGEAHPRWKPRTEIGVLA